MRFGIIQEAENATSERYLEMLDEAELADELGFHAFGFSERHFLPGRGVSAPEVLFGALAARTKQIKLRFMSVVLLAYNHPLRVAEQIATIDLISSGRAEASTARTQQPASLKGFGIDPNETRAQWAESLDVVIKALTQDTFSHEGTYWQIPELSLTPKPVQLPHPPLYASATSVDTHRIAGEKGLGVLSGNSLVGGWEYVEEVIDVYRGALAECSAPISAVPPIFGVASLVGHCAETAELAKEQATPRIQAFLDSTISRRRALAPSAADYGYQQQGFDEIEQNRDNVDNLIARSPYFTVGTPELFIERARRLEAMGVDEFVIEVEGMGHAMHMQTIGMIGKHVIPHFSDS